MLSPLGEGEAPLLALGRRRRRRRWLVPRLRRQLARRPAAAGHRRSRPGTHIHRCIRAAAACSCLFGRRLQRMRVPTDLPSRMRPGRRYQAWIVGAVVFVIVALIVIQGLANFYTNYLWYRSVNFTSVWRLVDRDQARACRGVHRRVLHRLLGQPLGGRPHRPEGFARLAGARDRPPLPADRRQAHFRAAHGRVPHPRPHRRGVDERPVAALAAVPQRQALRGDGPAVPQVGQFLRVQAAVPVLPRRLDARGAPGDPDHHGHRPLPQRWAQVPGPLPTGRPARHRAHVGDPRCHGTGPGSGVLLRRPLQPRAREGRLRERCRLHRRARALAGDRAARCRRSGGVRADGVQRLPTKPGASRDRSRAVDTRRPGRRRDRPGCRAGPQGHARTEQARSFLTSAGTSQATRARRSGSRASTSALSQASRT